VGNVGPLSNFARRNTVLTVSLLQTGVGKSSLVSSVFNIGLKVSSLCRSFLITAYGEQDIDIAHDHVGKANIAHEYTSNTNPRFILHDSQGFEHGSLEKLEVVEKFIREKCDESLESEDRLHAIW
jgi:predicted GTPase